MTWHLKHEIHKKPWAVQEEAIRRSGGRPRYGFWMEMGLGKTSLTLNEYMEAVYDDQAHLNIVLVPNSFKADWPLAAAEWGLECPAGSWPDDPLPFDWEWGVYAINYEAATRRHDIRGSTSQELLRLIQSRRCMVTIDESKSIGNPSSDTTKRVLELVKPAAMVRALNGTPMTENVMEYWPQLRALGEVEGMNPYAFRNKFAVMGGFMGKQIKGQKSEEELAAILDRCSFRALKKDWRKDLPPQIHVPVTVEMTDNQLRHYRTMMEEFYAAVSDETMITASLVLTQYDKLRQISSGLVMQDGEHHWIEKPTELPKMRALIDLLSGASSKMIVSYYYRPSGEALFDVISKLGGRPAVIKGGMKPAEIIEEKRRFNEDPECRVLIGQEGATFRGHTLVGKKGDRCDRIAFYESSFSLYRREQMKDRNHRGDQDEPCHLYDFVSSPIERMIVDGLVRKKSAADTMDDVVKLVRSRLSPL